MPTSLGDVNFPLVTASQKFSKNATNSLQDCDEEEAEEWLRVTKEWVKESKKVQG